MAVATYQLMEIPDSGKLPSRSISELEWMMSEDLYVQLYSADGQRSVDVHCARLLDAVNSCAILAEACGLDLVALGDILDQVESVRRDDSAYARAYVGSRITDPYWQQKARRIVDLAPEGSGTREALRYLLATLVARNVLY